MNSTALPAQFDLQLVLDPHLQGAIGYTVGGSGAASSDQPAEGFNLDEQFRTPIPYRSWLGGDGEFNAVLTEGKTRTGATAEEIACHFPGYPGFPHSLVSVDESIGIENPGWNAQSLEG